VLIDLTKRNVTHLILLENTRFFGGKSAMTKEHKEVKWSRENHRFAYPGCGLAHHSICSETGGHWSAQ